MKRTFLSVIGVLALLVGLLPGSVFAAPLSAQVITPVPGPTLTIVQLAVNDGEGGQTDPHVSGDWASYTDNSVYGIRFQNLDLGAPSDRLIPHVEGLYDSLSDINYDISGVRIAFMRGNSSAQTIHFVQIDPFGNPGPAVEISPVTGSMRGHSAIGGDTIAYEDRGYGGSSSSPQEISVSSVVDPASSAERLTNDLYIDQIPAVSPDGNAVAWVKCPSTMSCDVWRAERTTGAWGTPEQVTGAEGNESLPDTNGPVTVYGSTAGGDDNIRWSVKDSSDTYIESYLALPGIQRNPNISGDLITFESSEAVGSQYDIWLYDLATNRLYQLTNTSVSESLSDVTTGPGGLVRVVWAQPKQVYPYDMDVYALSFLLDTTPPVITPSVTGTLGSNDWYTSNVTLSWSVTDDVEQTIDTTGCDAVSITSDQAVTDYTCSAEDAGGTSSETVSIARDATKPVTSVTEVTEGATYELGSVPQAGCASTDNLSGVATEATLSLSGGDAQGVGSITATCSGALDTAGNAADAAVVHYTVTNPSNTYPFTGFFPPVDNWPTENTMKAGASVPVKFSLGGDRGLNIFSTGYPLSKQVACPASSSVPVDPIEEITTSTSGLSYDAAADQYIYVWKTNKLWAGTCRVFTIQFADGSPQQILFKFSK